jgi:hypothetical protein
MNEGRAGESDAHAADFVADFVASGFGSATDGMLLFSSFKRPCISVENKGLSVDFADFIGFDTLRLV